MRHLIALSLLTLIVLPLPAVHAEDEVDPNEAVSVGTIPAEPRKADTPIDVVKPPTILYGPTYTAIWSTTPETVQVAEHFGINLELRTKDQTAPLMLADSTNITIAMVQRRGNCALLVPATLAPDGTAIFPAGLMVPFSGGYEIYLQFTPAGESLVTERIALFVEGVAENGADITAFPRSDGPWSTMPAFTQEATHRVMGSAASYDGTAIGTSGMVWGFDAANLSEKYADPGNAPLLEEPLTEAILIVRQANA